MGILVLGDLIIDEYWTGVTDRISPEAPVPVITNVIKSQQAGGAANVALNIKSMGSPTTFISQADLEIDFKMLHGLDYKIFPCDQTPRKTRILSNNHVICRLDTERFQEVTPHTSWFDSNPSICVLSDYNKGFLVESQSIIQHCNESKIKTIVDPKQPWKNYQGCWLLKANAAELKTELGRPFDLVELESVCHNLSVEYTIENLIITLGHQGLFVWTPSASKLVQSENNQVIDVTGAGDVVIASLAHYIYQGIDLITAAEYANKLAAIAVNHLGCYVVTPSDLNQVENKIVFTNGCFDVLHKGHIDYLRTSKSYGTKLVIGLNSDASVRNLKGPGRPINDQQARKALLESLEFVDEVIIFDEPTPRKLIMEIKPDIITKGGDYTVDQVVGNDLVNQIIIVPLTDGYSTTSILNKVSND